MSYVLPPQRTQSVHILGVVLADSEKAERVWGGYQLLIVHLEHYLSYS